MRRSLPYVLGAALGLALAIGLIQATSGGVEKPGPPFELETALTRLEGAPAPLEALHDQSSELLDGSLEKRLDELRGHPVVVNKWGSWCGPCRAEFPIFQKVSTDLGKEVAFLGLNGSDNRDSARDFLRKFPLPFPSYVDPDEKQARGLDLAKSYPMTAFYDERGKQTYVHIGEYDSTADLLDDIEQYAR